MNIIITFDANHEMGGKELNFHIELVEIKQGGMKLKYVYFVRHGQTV